MQAVRIPEHSWELRQRWIAGLRRSGMLPLADTGRFALEIWKRWRENYRFRREHPLFMPPPISIMYDANRHVSLREYAKTGEIDARMIADRIARHCAESPERVLEWGCGPARILRHLPAMLPPDTQCYGVDYNASTIRWCSRAMPGIVFGVSGLLPPVPFTDVKFDVIYAVSVFTHLSEASQLEWARALREALSPNGILIITTHGERCLLKLLPQEKERFYRGDVVVRGGVREGTRCFVAYHPSRYVREKLFPDMEVLEDTSSIPGTHMRQDIWVLRRSAL